MKNKELILLALPCILLSFCSIKDRKATELYEPHTQILGYIGTQGDRGKNVCIYMPDTCQEIELTGDTQYRGFSLMNTRNSFIARGNPQLPNPALSKNSILEFNLKGDIIQSLYCIPTNHDIYQMEMSPNDSKLLYTFVLHEKEISDDSNLGNIAIVNLWTKDVQIHKIAPGYKITISSSPWSPDENKFVYHISRGITYGEKAETHYNTSGAGLYVYDLEKRYSHIIAKDGIYGIWSPIGKYIAYFSGGDVFGYNTASGAKKLLYKKKPFERIRGFLYWLNKGQYLYFDCPRFNIGRQLFSIGNQRLINIETNEEIPFKHLKSKPHSIYDWKESM